MVDMGHFLLLGQRCALKHQPIAPCAEETRGKDADAEESVSSERKFKRRVQASNSAAALYR